MPLFFLHQRRGATHIRDEEGAEFADFAEARAEAIVAARELMSEMVHRGHIDLSATFEIEGPSGEKAVVPFSDALEIRS
jgi:hypothetical protein